jgi:molecular chaperone GrpE
MKNRQRNPADEFAATEPEATRDEAAASGPPDPPALELEIAEDELLAAAADASGLGGGAREELERLRREIGDLKERHLRALADFENYRRRSEREREENRRFAVSEMLRDLAAVADNFGLAVRADGSVEDLRQGVGMIQRQFGEVLRRWGLREVEALGKPFDPAQHEAVATREDSSVDRPTVATEHRRGYWLHDRLLRPALVEVAVPSEKASIAAAEADDGRRQTAALSEGDGEAQ